MSTNDPAADKSRQGKPNRSSDTIAEEIAELAPFAAAWDARDVLAGRVDDTTVRQAAEVGDDA